MTARRWTAIAGLVGLAAFALWAWSQRTRPDPVSPSTAAAPRRAALDFAGCAEVLVGPRCAMAPDDTLTVFLPVADPRSVHARLDGEELDVTPTPVPEGVQLKISGRLGVLELEWSEDGRRAQGRLPLVAPTVGEPVARAFDARAAGRPEEAKAILQKAQESGALDAADLARARGLEGRIVLAEGKTDEAIALLAEASEAAWAAGLVSRAVDDDLVRVYALALLERQLTEARELADATGPRTASYPDGAANLTYYWGSLANESGDLDAAARLFEVADVRASHLGLTRLRQSARQMRAMMLLALGRPELALKLLEETPPPSMSACDRAMRLLNLGWARLVAAEAQLETSSPRPPLIEALELFEGECERPRNAGNVHINLALTALLEEDAALAKRHLDAATALGDTIGPRIRLWTLEIAARVAQLEGDLEEAKRHFSRLRVLAQAALLPELERRGALGEARVLVARGDLDGAITAYKDAEALLEEARALPGLDARHAYLSARDKGARELVELLLRRDDARGALDVARRARVRGIASAAIQRQLASLGPVARARWERAIGDYRRLRESFDAELAGNWALSARELEVARSQRGRRETELREALDGALQILREASPVSYTPPPIPEDALTIMFFPTAAGWVGFAATADRVEARRLGQLSADAPLDDLGRALLAPFDGALEGAKRIRVLTYGELRAVDMHRLPWRGRPLLTQRPVVYPLDLSPGRAPKRVAEGVLLIADPLGNLAAARREADLVEPLLAKKGEVSVLAGAAATREAVEAGLARAAWLHYAGHAEVREGLQPFLPLAGQGALFAGDILAQRAVPETVVLASCDAARTPNYGGENLGVAQAFVLRGAREVVAASRQVADSLAADMSVRLYTHEALSVSEAARDAQLSLLRDEPDSDWSAFRVLVP